MQLILDVTDKMYFIVLYSKGALSLLSYHLSLRPLFCLCLSGRLRQVLLYVVYLLHDCCHLIFVLANTYISSNQQTGSASVMEFPP